MQTRTILHLDLDAFFCAVEELRDPSLRGKAFAVGGKPEERGVVASCSYAARRQGVHSAMPMGRALRLCPGLIVISPRHNNYGAVSKQVMAIVHALTPLVEQISIDEAYLDITQLGRDGAEVARELQSRIRTELDLPCSLGVASNKLVAKIANNVGKAAAHSSTSPNAVTVVEAGREAAFLAPLACSELWGVGPKTAQRLKEIGIQTVGQLALIPESELVQRFGKNGLDLARHARGIDDSPIITQHERKSISQETTFVRDVQDESTLKATLFAQAKDVAVLLQRKQLVAGAVKIKVRWSNFTTVTRQVTLPMPTSDAATIFRSAVELLDKAWDGRLVRLIGLGAGRLTDSNAQATLFDLPNERQERLQETLRTLRDRFGDEVVKRASELEDE
jgi:DNA polymerase-4